MKENRTGMTNSRARERPPRDSFIFLVIDDVGVPLETKRGWNFCYPMRFVIVRRAHRFEMRHKARQVFKITPERINFLRSFTNGDGFFDLQASFRRHQRAINGTVATSAAIQQGTPSKD